MDKFSQLLGSVNDAKNLISNIQTYLTYISLLSLIPMILNCFFGYKLLKLAITLGGFATGALTGLVLGLLAGDQTLMIVFAVVIGLLFGFLAFKLYKVGIFIHFWLLGTIVSALLLLTSNVKDMLIISVFIGLILGIMAVMLHKPFIILTTSVAGGMSVGLTIGNRYIGNIFAGIGIGIILSALGILCQHYTNRTKAGNQQQPGVNGYAAYANQPIPNAQYQPQPAGNPINQMPVQLPNEDILSNITPNSYCPKSRLLIEEITLLKDAAKNTLLKVDFINIGEEIVNAVFFRVTGCNVLGEQLGEQVYSVIDLNVSSGCSFSSDKIQLFDNNIRNVDITITKVLTANNNILSLENEDTLTLPEAANLTDLLSAESIELLNLEADEKKLYTPLEEGFWLCTCGHIGYHRCSYCGRTPEQLLHNTDSDVTNRIQNYLDNLCSMVAFCKKAHEFQSLKETLEHTLRLMTAAGIDNSLIEKGQNCIANIDVKLETLSQNKADGKKKHKKIAILSLAGTLAAAALTALVLFLIGLPPSESRIDSDIEKDILEQYGHKFSVIKTEQTSDTRKGKSSVTAYRKITLLDNDNNDLVESEYTAYYEKDGLRYSYLPSNAASYPLWNDVAYPGNTISIIPNHEPGNRDNFVLPDLSVAFDNYSFYINSYDLQDTDYCKNLVFDIDYSSITFEETKATVPVTITADVGKLHIDSKTDVKYTYIGNYDWSTSTAYVSATSSTELLTGEKIEQLVQKQNYDCYDYYDMLVEGCKLSLTDTDLDINYNTTLTEAYVYGPWLYDGDFKTTTAFCDIRLTCIDDKWSVSSFDINSYTEGKIKDNISFEQFIPVIRRAFERNNPDIAVYDITLNGYLQINASPSIPITYVMDDGTTLTVMSANAELYETEFGYNCEGFTGGAQLSQKLKQEIHTTMTTPYSQTEVKSNYSVWPSGMSTSGTASFTLDVNENLSAVLKCSIGTMNFSLSGHYNSDRREVRFDKGSITTTVRWKGLISYYTDTWDFTISPSLSYSNNSLSGYITFEHGAYVKSRFEVRIN